LVAVSAVVESQLCAALKFAYLLTTATNLGTQDPSQLKQPYEVTRVPAVPHYNRGSISPLNIIKVTHSMLRLYLQHIGHRAQCCVRDSVP